MTLDQLKLAVLQWAWEKGILDNSAPLRQHVKTQEEVNELLDAISKDDKAEIADAIGDIAVTIIIQAELNELDFTECLRGAYDVIAKRRGKMVDGIFVKDE